MFATPSDTGPAATPHRSRKCAQYSVEELSRRWNLIARGIFTSSEGLAKKIVRYIRGYNQSSRRADLKYSDLSQPRLRAAVKVLIRYLADEVGSVPVLGQVMAGAYKRRFDAASARNVRLFSGIYPNFAAAVRAVPPGRLEGYDNDDSAYRVIDEWLQIGPHDYPLMFRLSRLLPECTELLDWGGNVGLKYFAYRRYIPYPSNLTWWVSDVPAVVAVGKGIAERERAHALRFTTTLEQLSSADLLFAIGALNFVEDPFTILAQAAHLPRHLILSQLPLYEQPSAATLHNMGTAFCPYHLFNRSEFIERILRLGYELIDEWTLPDIGCSIPFFPLHSISAYSGFYFRKSENGQGTSTVQIHPSMTDRHGSVDVTSPFDDE